MSGPRREHARVAGVVFLVLWVVLTAGTPPALGGDDASRDVQPAVCRPYCYNSDYLFSLTRDVHNDGGLHPAAAAALLPLTLVADLILLPWSIASGLLG